MPDVSITPISETIFEVKINVIDPDLAEYAHEAALSAEDAAASAMEAGNAATEAINDQKGEPGGIPSLDGTGKTVKTQLPDDLLYEGRIDSSGGVAANDTSILSLSTVNELSSVSRRNRTRAFVNGGGQGGSNFTYYPVDVDLTVDQGIVYEAPDGGFWKRDFNSIIDASWFIVGDGESDDSDAIQNCYTTASLLKKTVNQRGLTIKISKKINIESNVTVEGGEFITDAALPTEVFNIEGENISFIETEFDFNENNNYGINVKTGSKNITFSRCNLRDLKEISGNGIITCAIRIEAVCSNISVSKTKFENITPIENSTTGDTQGAGRAILVGEVTNCLIDDCDFIEIKGLEDGDCIQVQAGLTGNVYKISDVTVANCRFPNIYKRAIKFQSSGGRIFNNTISSITTSSVCTFAAISIFGSFTDILDNKINLARATCVFELGAVSDVKNINLSGNKAIINETNLYSSTASTSIISFIKLNATSGGVAENLYLENNEFTGHARALYVTSNSIANKLFFIGNICTFSTVYQSGNNTTNGWEISDNTFVGNGASSSHGGTQAIFLVNPNDVLIQKNVFKSTNSFKIGFSGVVGSLGVIVGENTIISPNSTNYISKTGISSGGDRVISKLSQQRKVMEGTTPPSIANEGDSFLNIAPSSSKIFGWSCVQSSVGETPAVWEPINTSGGSVEQIIIKGTDPTSGSALPLLTIRGSNGLSRYILGKRNAESGSNAGSNLVLTAYQDGGGGAVEVLSILRSSGYVGLGISAPTQQLDLSGKIRARGGIILGSTEISIIGASANAATDVGATYSQAEVQAILTELRDLKTKMRTAGLLAT